MMAGMPPACVLLVDDDPWIGRMVSGLLARRGHRIEVATDGESGLAQARRLRPDLVLLEIRLPQPGVDGWHVLKELRADPELAAVPVVLLTVLGSDEDRLRALRLGADDYLIKPFRFEELDLRAQAALRKRRGHQLEREPAPRTPSLPPSAAPLPHEPSLPPSGVHGTLDQLGLGSLLAMLEMERKSGIVSLQRVGARGRLLCRNGQIVRAELLTEDDGAGEGGPRRGMEAITVMLGWSAGRFDFIPSQIDSADEIGVRTTHLLMEAARQADEAARPQREVS